MISVTRPGGLGFFSLTYQGQRLAYLRHDPDEVIYLHHKAALTGPSRFIIYEIWDAPLWAKLTGDATAVVNNLRNAMAGGDLGMTKVLRSPTGQLITTNYDLKGSRIEQLTQEVKVGVAGNVQVSQTIRFDPPPIQIFQSVSPPEPAKPTEVELEPPDVSAPIYALRSFNLARGRLRSLYKEFYWDEGKAIATCINHDPKLSLPGKDHEVPASGCTCGLYGLQSLDRLVREYGKECSRCVAVFAAEGRTIVGDRGLKTKAARVVAYWVQTKTELDVMAKEVPKAKHYTDMAQMLEDFHFPAWGTVEPDYLPATQYQPEVMAEGRWKYTDELRPELPPRPRQDPDAWKARRRNTNAPQGGGVVVSNFRFTVADTQKAMGPAATPGGLAAIQHVYDIVTGKKTS